MKMKRGCANSNDGQFQVLLAVPTAYSYIADMKVLVTSKGQVTIPKELRDRFGIEPGAQVDFVAADDGIRVRKVVDRRKQAKVLGCLKTELAGQSVADILDELRGPVELPKGKRR
jgi:AbrB family looped-hinge helix DNA binding protein